MATFFRALPWHTLDPDGAAITWDAKAPNGTQRPYQKANADRSVILAYLPQANGDPHAAEGPPGTPPVGCRPPLHPPQQNSTCVGCYGGVIHLGAAAGTAVSGAARDVSWFNPVSAQAICRCL